MFVYTTFMSITYISTYFFLNQCQSKRILYFINKKCIWPQIINCCLPIFCCLFIYFFTKHDIFVRAGARCSAHYAIGQQIKWRARARVALSINIWPTAYNCPVNQQGLQRRSSMLAQVYLIEGVLKMPRNNALTIIWVRVK